MPKAKVYRSGAPVAPLERGCERASYEAADALRPAGRQGRMDAIFASPTLAGVTRWVRANAMCNIGDVLVRELTVDPDAVYVYSIAAWEQASWAMAGREDYAAYWASGMTLTEWLAGDYDAAEWELLLGPADLLSVRPVSDKRVVAAVENSYRVEETKRALQTARARSRWAAQRAA